MNFNYIDFIVMALFFLALIGIPAVSALKAKGKGANEYFKSAGSMPWWLIGVSMVAATTSTNSANLFTEIIRRDGLSGNWVWWAFLLTGMLTVFVYSKLWVRSGATTDISFYELRYSGKPAAFLRGFRAIYLGVIYNLVVMATVLLGAVKIGVVLFGVPASTVLIVTAVASLIYSCLSGIRGTIYTDFFIFAVVMAGACAVMYYSIQHPAVGGWANLMSNPEVTSRLSFFPDFSNRDAFIAIFIIPVAVQWWNVWYSGSEPGGGGYIVQRMLTARSPKHAIGGTLFFNVLNYALRPWPWYIAAFASLLIFPNLDAIREALPNVDPSLIADDMAYPALIRIVPNGWVGLVAASLMGALFSTIAAQLSMGANYVANDVWKRFIRKNASDREMILVARITSIILMVTGCLLAPCFESAKAGFDLMVQVGAGTGIIFLLRWFWMRINAWTEIVAMGVSFLAAVFFQFIWPAISDTPLLFWEKLLWTIAVTTVVWLAVTFLTDKEKPEVISKFKSLVRADKNDVGKGLLKMFLSSIAIFAFMWAVGAFIVSRGEKPYLTVPKGHPSEWMECGCVNWADKFPAHPDVKFRVWHDSEYFNIEYQVCEDSTRAEQTVPGGFVHMDSCMECYIHPDPENSPYYYSIETNAAGQLNFARRTCRDDAEQAPLEVIYSVITEPSLGKEPFGMVALGHPWTLKVSIPASALFHDNLKTWDGFKCNMNVNKCTQGRQNKDFLTWAPVDTPEPTFQKTSCFRSVIFEK